MGVGYAFHARGRDEALGRLAEGGAGPVPTLVPGTPGFDSQADLSGWLGTFRERLRVAAQARDTIRPADLY